MVEDRYYQFHVEDGKVIEEIRTKNGAEPIKANEFIRNALAPRLWPRQVWLYQDGSWWSRIKRGDGTFYWQSEPVNLVPKCVQMYLLLNP